MLGTMPDQIIVAALEGKSSQYRADKMALYEALYEGGDKFESMKETFLPKRPIEKSANTQIGGGEHYKSRLSSAYYTNYAGGLIDWFTAKIVENNPRIVVDGSASEEAKEYWEGLNEDADGLGNPLITLCRWAARDVIINARSYFGVDFQSEGDQDGKICLNTAIAIDDWDQDAHGTLIWVRRHTSETMRDEAEPWKCPTVECHYWTFYDAEKVVVYKAEKLIAEKQFPKNAVATKEKEMYHDFGLPVFDIRADQSMWIMDRIKEPILKLFRREASLNWYLDSLCYQMPVFNLQTPSKYQSIPVTPLGAVVLEIGESASFLKPDAAGFEPNFKAVEQCKQSFYESLQVLAKEASSIPQAGRLSGDAIAGMQKPMEILIDSFSWPIRNALMRLIEQLKKYRNEEDLEIELEGFGGVEVDDMPTEEEMNGRTETAERPSTSEPAPDSQLAEE